MGTPQRRKLELNELGWWANWAKLQWIGKNAYVLTSDAMTEAFFNKWGLLTCSSAGFSIEKLEDFFQAAGKTPTIMVYDSCWKAKRRLARAGYRRADVMTVMGATGEAPPARRDVEIEQASSAEGWSRVYLSSFYGEFGLLPTVEKVARRLLDLDSAKLLEARLGGRIAGGLAAYRTDGLLGVYCVGTVPEFRGRGVAAALLARAREIASAEGRALFLQTLKTDNALGFYAKQGFSELYKKAQMQKKG